MSFDKTRQHDHASRSRSHLAVALAITISFFVVELIGGYITNSLALAADAWHMLNDAVALAFALIAAWIAGRPSDLRKTFGYHRTEILAAFLNGIFLWAIVILIIFSAIQRLQTPATVASLEMLLIAVIGLAANGLSAGVLSRSKSESLNVKSAFLHVVSDTLGSVAVIAAGLVMFFTGWYQADPIFSMLVAILISYGAYKLIRESINVLLEGVPPDIDMATVERKIREQKGVKGVHDLHVWCITPTKICALSCHVVVEESIDRRKLMSDLIAVLDAVFGIDHTTIQLEEEGYPKAHDEH
ncbi:cation diffusion facilitator family transporter [Candidatus Bathyarchaeota archaeon]|nr:cation diffusion facilitator family transporter [Candidatus Bathyarchaeota archaeon]